MTENLENHPTYLMFREVSKNITKNLYEGHFNYEGAIDILQNYIPLAEKMESRTFVGIIHNTLAIIELELGHFSSAENYYQQAIAAYEYVQNLQRISVAVCGLGELYRKSGKIDEAIACYHRSRTLAEAGDDTRMIIYNYANEGQLWLAENDLEKAIDMLEKGLVLVEQADWKTEYRNTIMPEILSSLGEANAKLGNYDLAQSQSERALDLAQRKNQIYQMAYANQTFALIAIQRNESAAQISVYFEESKALWQKMGAVADLGRILLMEADYWQSQDDLDKYQACLEKAKDCFESTNLDNEVEAVGHQINRLNS